MAINDGNALQNQINQWLNSTQHQYNNGGGLANQGLQGGMGGTVIGNNWPNGQIGVYQPRPPLAQPIQTPTKARLDVPWENGCGVIAFAHGLEPLDPNSTVTSYNCPYVQNPEESLTDSHLRENFMLLCAAKSDKPGELVKIPGVGSVRLLGNGPYYYVIYN